VRQRVRYALQPLRNTAVRYQDQLTPLRWQRWTAFGVLTLLYMVKLLVQPGWYVVSYALGIYLLSQFVLFLMPAYEPEESADALPTRATDEFKPFDRKLPEYRFWCAANAARAQERSRAERIGAEQSGVCAGRCSRARASAHVCLAAMRRVCAVCVRDCSCDFVSAYCSRFSLRMRCFVGLVIGFALIFDPRFDIPVYWPILLMYFVILSFVQLKQRVSHMWKHGYLPWNANKPRYTHK
jgi:hypothetical protein